MDYLGISGTELHNIVLRDKHHQGAGEDSELDVINEDIQVASKFIEKCKDAKARIIDYLKKGLK